MSAATAVFVAWWMLAASATLHLATCAFKDQPASHRVVDLVFVGVTIWVLVSMWPLAWGGAP